MLGRNDPCWCGSGEKWKKCHYPDLGPQNYKKQISDQYWKQYKIILKNAEQIEGIRRSCKLAAEILDKTCKKAQEGITTLELNRYAHQLHLEAGAIPASLNYGYPPFPGSICTSLNEVICHGIPDNTILKKGDILNIDVSCILNGYFGDCSKMVCIGDVSSEKLRVVNTAYNSLMKSIEILKPGIMLFEIGDVIEDYANKHGCSVVNQFVGHGVGIHFHEAPQVPHHRNKIKIPLVNGMTFTIEPMINAGIREGVIDPIDGWTARTKDNKPSAQWEHTILITEDGHEILTLL